MKSKMKQRLAVLVVCALLTSVFPVGNPVTGKAESETAGSGNHGLNNPIIDPASGSQELTVWDCVWFGNYWQEDTNGDGVADQNDAKQPIKWRVLSVDGDDAFLLADKFLDCRPYNVKSREVTWETCTMRSWLNGYGLEENEDARDYSSNNSFLANAFSAEEQSAIQITNVVNNDNGYYRTEGGNDTQDKVYLLSLDEVMNPGYRFSPDGGDDNRKGKATGYTIGQGEFIRGSGYWWLRSPGDWGKNASDVSSDGSVRAKGHDVSYSTVAVRPALHLNLSSTSCWSYAGKVYWTGEVPQPTQAPTAKPQPTKTPTKKSDARSNASTSTATSVGKVSSLKLKQKNHTVTVSWKRVSNASGYQICYSTSKIWSNKKIKLTRKNKFTIKKLKKKKTYYFCVRAYQTKGKSKVYGSWSKIKKIVMKK